MLKKLLTRRDKEDDNNKNNKECDFDIATDAVKKDWAQPFFEVHSREIVTSATYSGTEANPGQFS